MTGPRFFRSADVDYSRVRAAAASIGRDLEVERLERIAADERGRRRWLLHAYDGKELVHESVCIGDRSLDLAMRPLEARRLRIVVRSGS